MKRIVINRTLASVIGLALGLSAHAQAAPLIYLTPDSQTVNLSKTSEFQIDVWGQDAGEPVGAFDFTLEWDSSIALRTFASFNPDGAWGAPVNITTSSTPDSYQVSLSGTPAGDNLAGARPFRIAFFKFAVVGLGTTNVDLTNGQLFDVFTPAIPGVQIQGGVVCTARLG